MYCIVCIILPVLVHILSCSFSFSFSFMFSGSNFSFTVPASQRHYSLIDHDPFQELISSPAGSRCSQTIDSQSEVAQSNCGPAIEEESQVINICPVPNQIKYVLGGVFARRLMMAANSALKTSCGSLSCRCPSADDNMDSGADSTTHCTQPEGDCKAMMYFEE